MSTDQNQTDTASVTAVVEDKVVADEVVSVSKKDYDSLHQSVGSLKRQLKDLQKVKEETKDTTSTKSNQDESALLQRLEKMTLRQAGITHEEDMELARKTAQKWGMDVDDVIADEDFKTKLERQQTNRSNALATSDIKGGAGTQQAKNTGAYWQAKGKLPTPAEVPDRKVRAAIVREMMKNAGTGGKTFYNE